MNMKMRKIVAIVLLILLLTATLCGCGRPTLEELLERDPDALEEVNNGTPSKSVEIKCKDYIIYYSGGIDDSIDATRYSRGLIETDDRFVAYHYVVEDRETRWKYIFEDLDDIVDWVN